MLKRSNLLYFAGITSGFLLAPDNPGGGGGGGGTQKEQLAQAQARISELEPKANQADSLQTQLNAAQSQLSAANTAKQTAETQLGEARNRITALEGEKTQLEAEVNRLKGEVGKTDKRAAEQLSAKGVNPGHKKEAPGQLDAEAADPASLWEQYAAASPIEQARMRNEHGAKLEAAAAAFDKAGKA